MRKQTHHSTSVEISRQDYQWEMVEYFLLSYRLLGSNSDHKAEFKESLTTEPSCWLRLCFVVLGDGVFILEYFRYLTMSTIHNVCSIAQSSLLMLSFAFLI